MFYRFSHTENSTDFHTQLNPLLKVLMLSFISQEVFLEYFAQTVMEKYKGKR